MFNKKLLQIELLSIDMDNETLRKYLNIKSKSTLSRKLNGQTEWKLSEIKQIRELLGKEKTNQIFFN